jgi:hypothetical protein
MCIFSNSDVKNEKISNSDCICCILFNISTNYMEMRRIIAYFLQVTGVVGSLFFLNYEGSSIPFRETWLVLSILACVTGIGMEVWLTYCRR